jgi:hypothetical protein
MKNQKTIMIKMDMTHIKIKKGIIWMEIKWMELTITKVIITLLPNTTISNNNCHLSRTSTKVSLINIRCTCLQPIWICKWEMR